MRFLTEVKIKKILAKIINKSLIPTFGSLRMQSLLLPKEGIRF